MQIRIDPTVSIDPELAARLALLYLRAAVPPEFALREDECAVGHSGPPVSTSEAARQISAMPKPLACYGTVVGDLLTVELRLPTLWRDVLTREPPGASEQWNDEQFIERYGADYRNRYVLCVGRGEWLLATFGEIAEWQRAHPFLGLGGWGGDDFADALAQHELPAAAVDAARARGAVYVQRFGPTESDDGVTGRIWVTRHELGHGRAIMCERCSDRPTQYAVHWFEGEHPARSLCQRCIDEELSTSQLMQAREFDKQRGELLVAERMKSRAELAEIAEEQAMRWALKHQPPFIRAFIARYRAE